MPERSNGAVSKTVDLARDPGVRIPLSPPAENPPTGGFFILEKNENLFSGFRKNKKTVHEVDGF
jgi:hypothetical protein